jgi:SAM-dependent methyltransferase
MSDRAMDHREAIDHNRRAWDETAAIHERARLAELLAAAAQPGFSTLDATEERVFETLGLGRPMTLQRPPAVAQLCCNNARELLSLKLRGAGRSTGFDLSAAFLAQGARLAAAAGVELELVQGSVYDIPARYDGAYDLVYVTVGALGWLPDLPAFFARVRRLLAPGGAIFIYEMHPILDMLDPDKGLTLVNSYFKREPFVNDGEPDYFDPSAIVSAKSYWFHHTLADVLGGCLREGLAIERFEEHPHDVSTVFAHLAEARMLPLSYTLVARKGA